MTVHKVAAINSCGYADYLSSTETAARRGDYYLGRDGAQTQSMGTWHGRGAEELGPVGPVTRDTLLRTWEGRDPRTREILVRRSAAGEHVAAVDCTFSAPKSISVLWALGDEPTRDHIEVAQDCAVLTAIRHIEATAPLVRRRVEGDIRHERGAGVIAARFRHHTSRLSAEQQVRGEAPDPQLHDHVAIANMALRDPELEASNGRWAAIDSRELYRIAAEAGAVYRAGLASRLQDLGYSVHREGRYVELDGIPVALREAFSARTAEVTAAREEFRLRYGREPRIEELKDLVVRSRQPKAQESAAAFAHWHERARSAGTEPAGLADQRTVQSRPSWEQAVAAIVDELTNIETPTSITALHSAVDDRHLRIAVAEAAQGRVAGEYLEPLVAYVKRSSELIPLEGGHWTTRALRGAEEEVVERAMAKSAWRDDGLSSASIAEAITSARVDLSPEQRDAVRHLCGPQAFSFLTAPAGAGKGEVLRTVAQAHIAEGHRVIGLAVAGETAQRLGEELGAPAMSVDLFVARVDHGRVTPTGADVVIVDEAALLETTRWRSLLRASGEATLVVAGDGRQLSPIEAGGMWRVLTRDIGGPTLMENYRAKEHWAKDAWTALREGRSKDAIRAYADRGYIHIEENRAAARERAVALWDQGRRTGRRRGRDLSEHLLVIDGSNREVDLLNRLAQERRVTHGELGPTTLRITARYERRGTVRTEDLHVGDRVVLTRAVRTAELDRRLENGERATVVWLTPEDGRATLQVRDGVIRLQGDDLNALRLGYAQHIYSAQGRTVDEVYVVTGGWQTSRASSYVAVSRAREASWVISDHSSLETNASDRDAALAELGSRMAVERPNEASLEYAVAGISPLTRTDATHTDVEPTWMSVHPQVRLYLDAQPPATWGDYLALSKEERAYVEATQHPRYLADRVTDRVLERIDQWAEGDQPGEGKHPIRVAMSRGEPSADRTPQERTTTSRADGIETPEEFRERAQAHPASPLWEPSWTDREIERQREENERQRQLGRERGL